MSTLIANLPPTKVWVHKHALRDYKDQYDEWTLGYWVSVKSIPGRAFYFETYLPEYGAMFDKLTIDAFRSWDPDSPDRPLIDGFPMPIEDLQFWNAFDQGVTVVEKNLISNMTFEVRPRSGQVITGKYLFTIDNYHPHRDEPDYYFSEVPDEHKSHNIVELDNGQIGAYPNNRCRMTDPSLSYMELKEPDFKVATRYVDVEHVPNWGRLGEQDDYFWETPEEKDAFEHIAEQSKRRPLGLISNMKIKNDICSRDEEWDDREVPRTGKEAQENPWSDEWDDPTIKNPQNPWSTAWNDPSHPARKNSPL